MFKDFVRAVEIVLIFHRLKHFLVFRLGLRTKRNIFAEPVKSVLAAFYYF